MVRLKSGKLFGEEESNIHVDDSNMANGGDAVDLEMLELEKTFHEHKDRSGRNFLSLLLDNYREQISFLKSELQRKDGLILDLINKIGCTNKIDTANSQSVEIPPIENRSLSVTELHKNSWEYPKNTVRSKFINVTSKPVLTTNRFRDLSQNEWLKEDETNIDLDGETSMVKSIDNESRKRPNIVTEKNPERNTQSPYRKPSEKRSVAIIGDSMIKNIRHWEISKFCPNQKIYVKSFPGADVTDMHHYSRPTAKRDPDLVILHCGTNNLKLTEDPTKVAEEIIDLANSLKHDNNHVVVSSLVRRADEEREKVSLVNDVLYTMCQDQRLEFMDNTNIQEHHLTNRGRFPGLHLNNEGNQILFSNFVNMINI